jgi:hypothetical protein
MSYPKYAYELEYELDHFEDFLLQDFDNASWTHDLWVDEWKGYSSTLDSDIETFEHPIPIVYKGEVAVVRHIDFPYTNNGWLVMSQKMLKVLKSVGDFPHREIPVVIKQGLTYNVMKEWYIKDGNLSNEGALTNYVFVQFTDYANVFDKERSIYEHSNLVPNRISSVEEYVFRIPPNGLPPLFKIPERPNRTFISADAREALKEAGITGVAYTPLNGYQSPEVSSALVDISVKIPKDWIDHRVIGAI